MRASIASGSNPEGAPKPNTAKPARAACRRRAPPPCAPSPWCPWRLSAPARPRRDASRPPRAPPRARWRRPPARPRSPTGTRRRGGRGLSDVLVAGRAAKKQSLEVIRRQGEHGGRSERAWSATMRSAARVTSERWPPPEAPGRPASRRRRSRRASSSSGDAPAFRAIDAAAALFSRSSAASAEPTASNASATSVAEVEAPPPVAVAADAQEPSRVRCRLRSPRRSRAPASVPPRGEILILILLLLLLLLALARQRSVRRGRAIPSRASRR